MEWSAPPSFHNDVFCSERNHDDIANRSPRHRSRLHDKAGLFEAAHGGILFLDEIGDMPLAAQAKLLRVLESHSIRRVGSNRDVEVDVWVIAATNRCIAGLVAHGQFRADLMYRLQVLWVEVPPLRSRDSDVLLLANQFLQEFSSKYDSPVRRLGASARVVF